MAKRVFELARELNLTTKELLIKIKDVDVPVKSHMSTLDDSEEAKVRETLFGKKSDDAIEETRVRSTVIRRRRKAVQEEEGEETAISAVEALKQEVTSGISVPEKDISSAVVPVDEESAEVPPGPEALAVRSIRANRRNASECPKVGQGDHQGHWIQR